MSILCIVTLKTHPSLMSSYYSSFTTHTPISHQGIVCSCLQATPSLVKTFQSLFMSYSRRTALSQEMTENERERTRGRGSDTGMWISVGTAEKHRQERGKGGVAGGFFCPLSQSLPQNTSKTLIDKQLYIQTQYKKRHKQTQANSPSR